MTIPPVSDTSMVRTLTGIARGLGRRLNLSEQPDKRHRRRIKHALSAQHLYLGAVMRMFVGIQPIKKGIWALRLRTQGIDDTVAGKAWADRHAQLGKEDDHEDVHRSCGPRARTGSRHSRRHGHAVCPTRVCLNGSMTVQAAVGAQAARPATADKWREEAYHSDRMATGGRRYDLSRPHHEVRVILDRRAGGRQRTERPRRIPSAQHHLGSRAIRPP